LCANVSFMWMLGRLASRCSLSELTDQVNEQIAKRVSWTFIL